MKNTIKFIVVATTISSQVLLFSCSSIKEENLHHEDKNVYHSSNKIDNIDQNEVIVNEEKNILKRKVMLALQKEGVPVEAIAISEITQNDNGYFWKFLNTKNGTLFQAKMDHNFESLKIRKDNGVSSW